MTSIALLEDAKLLGVFTVPQSISVSEMKELQYRTQALFRGLGRGKIRVVVATVKKCDTVQEMNKNIEEYAK